MRVLKFGGSSLANFERFSQVANIIIQQKQKSQLTVILSAPKGVTNSLVQLCDTAANGDDFSNILNSLADSLKQITDNSQLLPSKHDELYSFINDLKLLLDTKQQGIKLLTFCPDHIRAVIISRGETFSVKLMNCILAERSYNSQILDPSKSIVSSYSFLDGMADVQASSKTLLAHMKQEQGIYLLAGFSSANKDGQLTTLGRNGSDYSASVVAACLGADMCEIWTDVDGVYSTNPALVSSATLVSKLSYAEVMELSYFGASVLHPKTIGPLALYNIPCVIKNTMNPDAVGTLIDDKIDESMPIKGISNLDKLSLVTVTGPGMKGVVGMASRVFEAMALHKISVVLITQSSSQFSISFCIYTHNQQIALEALNEEFELEINANLLETPQIDDGVAIVSLVGEGMRKSSGIEAKFFTSLAQARVNILSIAQDSTKRSISAVVRESQSREAVKVCHENFFTRVPSIDLFLIGCGSVGAELVKQIKRQQSWLKEKNIDLKIYGVANSRQLLLDADGIDLDNWQSELENAQDKFDLETLVKFVACNHLLNPVLVDNTSSENVAYQYANFLTAGFHVVTPNKKANTGSMEYYRELRASAQTTMRRFLYETNVGAGLPVIDTLQGLFIAGDELIDFEGILSGSLSYIFGKLDDGKSLSEATFEAKELGYTEHDPRDDLSGVDVARKLLIMAREANLALELEDIEVESCLPADFDDQGDIDTFMVNLAKTDDYYLNLVQSAKSNQQVLRYVGQIKDGKCKVQIVAIDSTHPLYTVKDGENALAIHSRYYQPIPIVLRGYGAGAAVTAAGIFGDIMRTLSWQQEVMI